MSPSSEIQPVASDRANDSDQAMEESDGMQDTKGNNMNKKEEVRRARLLEMRAKRLPDIKKTIRNCSKT